MLQFYFLSIMLNLIAGMILVYGTDFSKIKRHEENDVPETVKNKGNSLKNMFENNALFGDRIFRLILGILTMFVGLMKLLSVVHDDVPVVGDLIPALAGLSGGFCLLVEYYCENASTELKLPGIIGKLFVDDRKYIGWFCITAAVLHFAFPDALLL
ncbi:MAG: hypothetical protein M0P01_06560 [Treponema sp.]|nr:hypothetical protein [Treponema sp.]